MGTSGLPSSFLEGRRTEASACPAGLSIEPHLTVPDQENMEEEPLPVVLMKTGHVSSLSSSLMFMKAELLQSLSHL